MLSALKPMIGDCEGATIVEYALLLALIGLVALTALQLLGMNLSSLFNTVAGSVFHH